MNWLDTHTIYGKGFRENLRRLQTWAGMSCSVLKSSVSTELWSKRTWLSELVVWMASKDISVEGMPGLQGGFVGDSPLVELGMTEEERNVLRRECWSRKVHW